MKPDRFIAVGENIHCTRVHKVDGKFVMPAKDGGHTIVYTEDGEKRYLPVSDAFVGNADWEAGKVKHCAVAIWQANYGDENAKRAGIDYLQTLAKKQEAADAAYLDVNVDEFSTDVEERVKLMRWTVNAVQQATTIPISVDSSNTAILRAGLEACDPSRGRPMVNSVSLERPEAVDTAAEFNAVVIASAAGKSGLPATIGERMANIGNLMEILGKASFDLPSIHIDPLVFPIATDSANGKGFLEAVIAIREKYGKEIHIVAGLSNVSFGMPNRKLINQVFSWLAVEAGADGGIVDPLQINRNILESMDTATEAFRLARSLLLGEDEFGMNYIMASREGKI